MSSSRGVLSRRRARWAAWVARRTPPAPSAPDGPAPLSIDPPGEAETAGGPPHPWFWQDGTMTDLGTLGGERSSWAYAINAAGQVVGWSRTAEGAEHAFLWQDGTTTDLGTLGGE